MTRNKKIGLVCLSILLVGTATSWFLLRDYFATREEVRDFTADKTPRIRLSLARGLELVLLPVKENDGPFASESPISNAQYAAAVADKAVAPPELPQHLGPASRKVNPDLPASLNPAPWEEVAWSAGKYPQGQEGNAVLFVTLDEALSYCRWLEKRFPAYNFRLPTFLERLEMETGKSMPNERLAAGDSAFPRATTGPKAIRIKNRFWLAPWTEELYPFEAWGNDELDNAFREMFAHRFGPSGRYVSMLGGSFGHASVLPTTFRVVVVSKDAPKKD